MYNPNLSHPADMLRIQSAQIALERARYDAQVALPRLLSADATFAALKQAVSDLSDSAPEDHDVLIAAFGIKVIQVRYVEPHTFVFTGLDEEGHRTFITCHFSQLVARVVYLPKRAEKRVITGFSSEPAA